MAKFKRFDPKNRKASSKSKYDDYTTTSNKYDYIKRKAECKEELGYYIDADSDDESKIFQPQRTGVRL